MHYFQPFHVNSRNIKQKCSKINIFVLDGVSLFVSNPQFHNQKTCKTVVLIFDKKAISLYLCKRKRKVENSLLISFYKLQLLSVFSFLQNRILLVSFISCNYYQYSLQQNRFYWSLLYAASTISILFRKMGRNNETIKQNAHLPLQ